MLNHGVESPQRVAAEDRRTPTPGSPGGKRRADRSNPAPVESSNWLRLPDCVRGPLLQARDLAANSATRGKEARSRASCQQCVLADDLGRGWNARPFGLDLARRPEMASARPQALSILAILYRTHAAEQAREYASCAGSLGKAGYPRGVISALMGLSRVRSRVA